MSLYLQGQQETRGPKPTDYEDLKEKEELVVQLSWVDLQGGKNAITSLGKTNEDTCESGLDRKRRKLDGTQSHLIIDMKVEEETLAQLICCYPRSTKNDGTKEIKGFDFVLTRGCKSSSDAVLSWLETSTGCNASESVFCPSVAHVAQATTRWTLEHLHLASDPAKGTDRTENTLRSTKPLVLTYLAPSGHAKEAGVESLSLMVPPVALHNLFNNTIRFHNQSGSSQWDQSKEDDDQRKATASLEKEGQITILRALECFLRKTFCIYVEKFSLIQASSSAGVLGCDGRCKPMSAKLLPEILSEIQYMVRKRPRLFDAEETCPSGRRFQKP